VDKAKQLADGLSVAWTQVGAMTFRCNRTRFHVFQGNSIPYGSVNINTSSPVVANVRLAFFLCLNILMASGQSNIAEAGTVCSILSYCRLTQFGTYVAQLTLEWSRLSQYTGDGKYSQLAENAALKIMNNVSPMKKVRDLLTLFF
jgi:hypothetical protein